MAVPLIQKLRKTWESIPQQMRLFALDIVTIVAVTIALAIAMGADQGDMVETPPLLDAVHASSFADGAYAEEVEPELDAKLGAGWEDDAENREVPEDDGHDGRGGRHVESEDRIVADAQAVDKAPGGEGVFLFDGDSGESRALSAEEAPRLTEAVDRFREADSEVGFVMYDFKTGRGIVGNADRPFFSASTVKAPYAAYVLQDEVEGGAASLDDMIEEDVVVDGTGVMAFDDESEYRLQDVVAETIDHSDNTGYALLRERFGEEGFAVWCARVGVESSGWEGMDYPWYSPRDLAKLWLGVGGYVRGGTPSALWLGDTLQLSDRSFLREALGSGASVMSKPGYEIASWAGTASALNDAGVVVSDTGAFVVVIMSDADYDDQYFLDNEDLIVGLAQAVSEARDEVLLSER